LIQNVAQILLARQFVEEFLIVEGGFKQECLLGLGKRTCGVTAHQFPDFVLAH